MEAIELEKRYVLQTYARQPFVAARGEGAWVWDTEGRRYLDCVAGIAVNALGHSDPAVVAAVCEQASRLIHSSNLYHVPGQGRLAQILCEASGLQRAFFCNSGTEANEAAIKFARRYWHANGSAWRHEIATFEGSFHGRTYGALSATGQDKFQEGFGPMLPGFVRVPFNDAQALIAAVGPHTAAVIIEPILAEGGVLEPDAEFVLCLQDLQRRHKFLLIVDEIQTGLGRGGSLFAHQSLGFSADIVTLAKPLGGGLPLGAVLMSSRVAECLKPGDHGSTFGGNPVAVAAGLVVMERLTTPGFLEQVNQVAAHLRQGLESLVDGKTFLSVRGHGMILGLVTPLPPGQIIEAARDRGLLVTRAGADVVRLVPPLVLSREQADLAVGILRESAAAVAAQAG